jgi:hypothetical protein
MTWAYFPLFGYKFRTRNKAWKLIYSVDVDQEGNVKELWANQQNLRSLSELAEGFFGELERLGKLTRFASGMET